MPDVASTGQRKTGFFEGGLDVASTGQRKTGFFEGGLDLAARDADVGDIQLVACEFGAEDDEAPVPVGGHEAFGITFREEAVFALLKMIAKSPFEHARKGEALV